MKSGTARRGGWPRSPVITIPTSPGCCGTDGCGAGVWADVDGHDDGRGGDERGEQAGDADHRWYSNVRWTLSVWLGYSAGSGGS